MDDDFFLKKGERGLLIGQTGSGKSENAIFHLHHAPVFPVIMFDTKIEDNLFKVQQKNDTLEVCNSYDEFLKVSKLNKKEMPDYILVRPEVHEVNEPELLDKYLNLVYHSFGACYYYLDETYNWHVRGQCGAGLLGLLTRGRSKGKTGLMATQRPSWISRFCFTESQKFYLHHMLDMRDRKTVDSMVPDFSSLPKPPKYHFYHFEVAKHDAPVLYSPVPFTELKDKQIHSKFKWI
jgi:hypothetical protein